MVIGRARADQPQITAVWYDDASSRSPTTKPRMKGAPPLRRLERQPEGGRDQQLDMGYQVGLVDQRGGHTDHDRKGRNHLAPHGGEPHDPWHRHEEQRDRDEIGGNDRTAQEIGERDILAEHARPDGHAGQRQRRHHDRHAGAAWNPEEQGRIMAPPSLALLAASGAMTPAMAPWPNGISDFTVRAA